MNRPHTLTGVVFLDSIPGWINHLLKWRYFHIPEMILWDSRVGNSTLPNLPSSGKDGVILSRNYSALWGNSQCILSLWFLSSKQFQLILSLAAAALLLLRALLTQPSAQIDLTNSEHVSHRWNFPPWRNSEALRSSTVWALMDAVMAVMKRGKKPDRVQSFSLNSSFLCPHLPTPNNGDVVTHAAS